MSIEAVLRSLMVGDATLSALVGTRVYPAVLPQGVAYPAIRYSQVSGGDDYDMDGPDDLKRKSYQFSCVALKRSDTILVADKLQTLLSGYSGVSDGISISAVFLQNEIDGEDTQPGNNEQTRYLKHLDFEVWYKTTT